MKNFMISIILSFIGIFAVDAAFGGHITKGMTKSFVGQLVKIETFIIKTCAKFYNSIFKAFKINPTHINVDK